MTILVTHENVKREIVKSDRVTRHKYDYPATPGADWTVGKSVIYRIKFTKKKKKKKK